MIAETSKKTISKTTKKAAVSDPEVVIDPAIAQTSIPELSPAFLTLAEPKLPDLQRENRARLLLQSPTRLYFYWSLKNDPFHTLKAAFGDTGSYTLVVKLIDLRRGTEELHAVEREGNWWFDAEPGGRYRAEIGYYAPNRPYFRIIYSNPVETPRRSPSPHPATDSRWTLSATKFAEVLDVAGFSQDAFDVAMAGDDPVTADDAAHAAFRRYIGTNGFSLDGVDAADIRYAMVALASGVGVEELRHRIGGSLFAVLQANADRLTSGSARAALGEYFDIDETEFTEEQTGSAVFGASLVNFPRTLRSRRSESKYRPFSSHSIR